MKQRIETILTQLRNTLMVIAAVSAVGFFSFFGLAWYDGHLSPADAAPSQPPEITVSEATTPVDECTEQRYVSAHDRVSHSRKYYIAWDDKLNDFMADGYEVVEIRTSHNPNLYILERPCDESDWWDPWD